MDSCCFDEILEKVRSSISAHERLCVTLRFLASGESYKDLMYSFRISPASISQLIPEVCNAIYNTLHEEYLSPPTSAEEWKKLADEFESRWQFPHAGAVDGKHVNLRAPPNTASEYFNYKKQFSIVLLAVADATAKFVAFDLGAAGSQSDGGIFKDGGLGGICKSSFFPKPSNLGEQAIQVPYFLLGDEAFALDVNMMKPYPHRSAMGDEKVYNYRLSRARRIVENAFGILCARFRVLLQTLQLDVSNVVKIVRACLALHNYLMTKKDRSYASPGFIDAEDEEGNLIPGTWRNVTNNQDMCDLVGDRSERPSTRDARSIRDTLKDYFFHEGAVEFQWKMTE